MWSCQWPTGFWSDIGHVTSKFTGIIFLLHLSNFLIGQVSAVSVRVTDSASLSLALNNSSVTDIIVVPDRYALGRRLLTLQGRAWPGQVANTIDGGRSVVIRSDPGDSVEIDFNRIPWIIEVGANASLELRDLTLTNFATISKSGNGAFPQYLYVASFIMWPSITSKPGAVINMVNTSTTFWSRTLFRNPDCKYIGLPASPDLEQATVLQGAQKVTTLPSGVVQIDDDDVVMQLPVLSLDNNTKVGAMRFAAQRCVAHCSPSLRSTPGLLTGPSEAPDQALPPASLLLAPSPPGPKTHIVAIASSVAAVGAALTAAAVVVAVLRSRRLGTSDREAAKPYFLNGKQRGHRLKPQGSFVSLESHLFRQSRMRRLEPLGNEEVEIGPLIGKGSFGRVHKGKCICAPVRRGSADTVRPEKGRWRNTIVAVKMVEHCAAVEQGLGVGKSTPQDSLQLETLLGLSLSHPNVVVTFRVCTVEAGTPGSSEAVSKPEVAVPTARQCPAFPGIAMQAVQDRFALRRDSQIPGAAALTGSSKLGGTSAEKGAAISGRGQEPGASNVGGANSSGNGLKGSSWITCYACVTPPATDEVQVNGVAMANPARAKPVPGELGTTNAAWEDEGEARMEHMETWMLMEYCERGSLDSIIKTGRCKLPNGHPNLPMIIACLLDIASGMAYLHAANVLHCDLKPANVLLSTTSANKRGFICKLGDFGMSRLLDITHKTHLSTQTHGTMSYMPPEMLIEATLTQQTDVYSFGMIMWELFSAQAVHTNMTSCQVFFAIVNERQRPTLDAFDRALLRVPGDRHMIEMYLDLMQRCWADEPARRPPFTDILTELKELKGLSSKVSAGRDSSRGL